MSSRIVTVVMVRARFFQFSLFGSSGFEVKSGSIVSSCSKVSEPSDYNISCRRPRLLNHSLRIPSDESFGITWSTDSLRSRFPVASWKCWARHQRQTCAGHGVRRVLRANLPRPSASIVQPSSVSAQLCSKCGKSRRLPLWPLTTLFSGLNSRIRNFQIQPLLLDQ